MFGYYRLPSKKRLPWRITSTYVARHVERPRVRSKNAYIALVTAFVSACSLAKGIAHFAVRGAVKAPLVAARPP
jgi:hypothetical protein